MNQFAKGINAMVPHAVWYDQAKIIFQPDLSPSSATYGPHLAEYNRYIGRLQRLLQGGRHVADIGVLYPIATLQAGSWFGPGNPYEGCVQIPGADYMEVGELLALALRRDFTFIHPEVLAEKCSVRGSELRLNNKVNAEQYKVFILPGARVIDIGSLRKVKEFYDKGGIVIATTCLPDASAEFGKDEEVRTTIREMFGAARASTAESRVVHESAAGGQAFFIPVPSAIELSVALDDTLRIFDVVFEGGVTVHNGNLSYIHKTQDGRDVYFFGNSSDTPVDTWVRLHGKHTLQAWDPHTGEIRECKTEKQSEAGIDITRVRLQLGPVRSLFLLEERNPNPRVGR